MRSIVAALALAAALALPAAAQVSYVVNGTPADDVLAGEFAAIGLPPGEYWLLPDGSWGVMGSPIPLGTLDGGSDAGIYGGSGGVDAGGSWGGRSQLPAGDGLDGDDGDYGGYGNCIQFGGWQEC